jgi:hypothetical protein
MKALTIKAQKQRSQSPHSNQQPSRRDDKDYDRYDDTTSDRYGRSASAALRPRQRYESSDARYQDEYPSSETGRGGRGTDYHSRERRLEEPSPRPPHGSHRARSDRDAEPRQRRLEESSHPPSHGSHRARSPRDAEPRQRRLEDPPSYRPSHGSHRAENDRVERPRERRGDGESYHQSRNTSSGDSGKDSSKRYRK